MIGADDVHTVREQVIQMKLMQCMGYGAVAVLSFALVLLAPATSFADKQVDAGTILLLSDEILGNSVEIERLGNGQAAGNPALGPAPTLADGGGDATSGDGDVPLVADGDKTGDSNDVSRSGFGDGTNAGLESDNNNSGNDGYDNPNNAPDKVGESGTLR